MSLDISLSRDGHVFTDINWLRNPFGLCQWAEDNVGTGHPTSLYYVCNHWNYDDGPKIDRQLFTEVVHAHADEVNKLTKSYFYFTLSSYRSIIQPKYYHLPLEETFLGMKRVIGEKYAPDGKLMIPVEHFATGWNMGPTCSTQGYQEWFAKLVEIADALQDPGVKFYCSN